MPGRRALTLLVVAALLAATTIATLLAYGTEREEADEADAARARQAALAVRQSVIESVAGLRGANALVAGGEIEPAPFKAFAEDVLRATPFSGIAWSEARPGALPVTLVHPNTRRRRQQLLGLDFFSDPERAGVARAAIRWRDTRMTEPLELANPPRTGVVVIEPVFRRDGSLGGVISTGAVGADIVGLLRGQLAVEEEVSVTDGGEMLGGEAPPPGDMVSSEINVLGRQWTVALAGKTGVDLAPVLAYAASGLALTLVAAGLFLLAGRRERLLVERQADFERLISRESLQVRITEAIEREIEGDARLGSLARQMVPAVADVCIVHEATAQGGIRRVGVAAPDEAMAEFLRELPDPPATSPIRAAISSRQPVLYTRVSEDREAHRARERGAFFRRDPADDEPSPRARFEAEQLSSMIVPLVARDRVLGTISLIVLRSSGRPPFTREDLAFAMEVATHAAVALDNARLYEQQRDIAGVLQGALVPRALIDIPGAEVAARHRAGMEGAMVGGDFYDLFEAGGHWIAVVGDVCGKGPEAAALTALARHTLRATARLGVAVAVARVHDAIRSSGEHTYCTLCCAELIPSANGIDARVVTAGHPEPWLVSPDGATSRLEVTGPLVGILDDPSFAAQELRLEPGTLFFMCSDGIPEARHNGEFFGEHRLSALLSALATEPPADLLARLEREVMRFVQDSPRDDLAMFALRVDRPPAG